MTWAASNLVLRMRLPGIKLLPLAAFTITPLSSSFNGLIIVCPLGTSSSFSNLRNVQSAGIFIFRSSSNLDFSGHYYLFSSIFYVPFSVFFLRLG